MIRYKNTHNGMILEVPDHYAPVYDRADNMQRLDPEPEPVATVDDLDSLTKRELREYAAENGIDLSGVRDMKAALIDAIASAPVEPAVGIEGEQVKDDEDDKE